jgi:hypothetical protein
MVRCWRSFSAAVVMTMLAVAPPAEAVPTGTYADRGTLRVVAAPGDRAVQVAVEQFDGGEAPGPGSYTDVVGHVRLTADVSYGSLEGRCHQCDGTPHRVVLDGGQAHADFSVKAWDSAYVEARLTAGARGGHLVTRVSHATFIGGGGPDRVTYRLDDSSGIALERGELVVATGRGDDVVVLQGTGARLRGPDGAPAVIRLGAGDDRFRARIVHGPAAVRVLGRTGDDDLQAGSDDASYGGPGDDILGNGRLIVGGSGRDVITAGWQTLRIQAADGEADTVTCLSHGTVVHADPVDRVSGCRVVLHA